MKVIQEAAIVINLLSWLCTAALSQNNSSEGRMEFILKNKHSLPHDSLVVLSRFYFQEGKIKEAKALHDSCFILKRETNDDRKIMAAYCLRDAVNNTNIALFSTIPGKRLKEADGYLRQAFASDSMDAEILFLFGKCFELKKKYEESAAWYRKSVKHDERCFTFGFKTAWLELAGVYEKLGKTAEAAEAEEIGTMLSTTEDDTWPLITMSFKLLKLGKEDRFSESFTAGLFNIPDSVLIDSLYYDAMVIASDEEKAEWDSLQSKTDKLEFLKRFWKSRDLDLTTETNERLAEHYKRLFHARGQYYFDRRPWIDARGAIYVRLGKPDKIYQGNPHGTNGAKIVFELNRGSGNEKAGLDQVDIASGQNIYPNESWFYDNGNLYFDFVNRSGYYELKPLTATLGIGSSTNFVASATSVMSIYLERNKYHPVYDRLLAKLSLQEIDLEFEKNMENTKKQHFQPEFTKPHFPVTFSFSSFRGKDNMTAVDFYYIAPLSELVFGINQSNLKNQTASLTVCLSVYDYQFKEVLTKKYEMNILKELSFDQSNYYLDVRRLQLKPGQYHIGFRALSDTVKEGIYKAKITVPDYSSDRLQISDIQTAFRIDEGMNADKYTKPGTAIRVLPNPGKMNNKAKPLFVYYEIYNLTLDADGKSRYQIEYKMLPDKSQETFVNTIKNIFTKQEGSIGSITTKEGSSTVSREYMAFDVSEVHEGASVLEITVTDLNTQHQSRKTTSLILKNEK